MISSAPMRQFLPNGSVAIIPATWEEYEQINTERGDRSIPRLKYIQGKLYIKMPTFEHGSVDEIVSDLIKKLLEQEDRDCVATTPVTLKVPEHSGIEPDHCFWVKNAAAVNGLTRIDLSTDPPPDLAIETDITNYTNIEHYRAFKIPEVWLVKDGAITIYALGTDGYAPVECSAVLPDVNIQQLFNRVVEAIKSGVIQSRAIRQAVREFLGS